MTKDKEVNEINVLIMDLVWRFEVGLGDDSDIQKLEQAITRQRISDIKEAVRLARCPTYGEADVRYRTEQEILKELNLEDKGE